MFINGSVTTSADTVSFSDVTSITDAVVSASDAARFEGFTTPQIITIIAVVFVLIMLALELLRSRYALTINRKIITLDNLPKSFDGTKIAVISDLHQMRFGEYNSELAKRIKREEPDYIFFVGDMGDSRKFNVDAFYDLLECLGDKIPFIAVPGNHDLRLGAGTLHKNFVREVERSGAVILHNTSAEMVSGGKKLYIYGFCQPLAEEDDIPAKKWKFADVTDEDVPAMLGNCPEDAPVILLAHDPRPFESYCAWGADLVLAGHMHGGIIRIPFLGGLLGPKKTFMPEYTAGIYTKDDTQMFVTTGLAAPLPRFLNPPEIAILTLAHPESELLCQPAEPIVAMPSFTLEREESDSKPREKREVYRPEKRPAAIETGKVDTKKDRKDESTGKTGEKTVTTVQHREKSGGKDIKSRISDTCLTIADFFTDVFAKAKSGVLSAAGWIRSEWRSLKDLLGERLNQLSDFFALMFGKKRSKYSRVADERKKRNTYVAPSKKKKKPQNRYRK